MGSMIENRVRTTMRASRIVWCMGVLAALGSVGAVVQACVAVNLVSGTLPRIIAVDEDGGLVISRVELSLGERLLTASPDILTSGALATAAFLLSAILVAVAGGNSFGAVTQRNLRRISVVLVTSSIVAVTLAYVANVQSSTAMARLQESGQAAAGEYLVIDGATAAVSWLPLALGVIAAAFRWVIRDGATLEQEAEGVI